MKIHHALDPRDRATRPALAIGVFDGVHVGHRALLAALRPQLGPGRTLAALTFRNHPLAQLRPETAPPAILTLEERVNRLAAAGVEELYLVPFDEELARTDADAFLERILVDRLHVAAVAVGERFRYGADRRGDVAAATRTLAARGVPLYAVPHVRDGDERVSSTRVRAALRAGDLADVDRWLGEPYALGGTVALGAGRGHDLGFPTANLDIPPELVLPPDGVYACRASHDGRTFAALVSIGTNPTFHGRERMVEAWLRGFDRTIYGERLTLRGLRLVREQRRFASVDELIAQMRRDAETLPEASSEAEAPIVSRTPLRAAGEA